MLEMTKDDYIQEQVEVINNLLTDGISFSHLKDIIEGYMIEFPPTIRVHHFSEVGGGWISHEHPKNINMRSKISITGFSDDRLNKRRKEVEFGGAR